MADSPDSERSLPWIARALLDTGPAALALLEGPDYAFTYANRAYLTLAGGREVVGRTFAQVFPEHAAEVLPLLERARASGLPVVEHERRLELLRDVAGPPEVVYLSSSMQPIIGRAGDPAAIALHLLDRTGEVLARRREAELAREREKVLEAELVQRAAEVSRASAEAAADEARRRASELDAVLESIADGLVITNPSGRVARLNATAQRLLGYSAAEQALPARERLALFELRASSGALLPFDQHPTTRALRGEVVRGSEVCFRRLDGSRPAFWATISAAPLSGLDGELRGAVTTFSDITRLRELQDQREDLMRAISHDLRTPLTVISAQAQMLARRPEDPAVVLRRAQALQTSTHRMSAMIEDLVEVIRLESGQVKVSPRPVPLSPFVAELRDRLRGALAVERIRTAVPEVLAPALADPARLERVLVNLLTNALKYSPVDQPVEVTAAPGPVPDTVRLTVRDHGPGIPQEELPRLFERFYRSPSARSAEGLGLGLYITRRLVEAHGGALAAESWLGQGSAFHVTLRAAG
ncbi:MAG: ATP-binding protein [Anaeromyxobacter sp.]